MSTAAVSSSSLYQQLQAFFQTRQSDVQQLGQDLQNGDLTDAQNEFNAITQLGQSGPFASGDAFRSSQREQDFNAIGTALQSGNLTAAQSAFAQFQSDFGNGAGANGATTGTTGSTGAEPPAIVINIDTAAAPTATTTPPSTTTTPAATTTTPAASTTAANSTATAPEIVINLGAANGSTPEQITLTFNEQSNGGEQLTIGVGNQQNNPGQELTLNLAQNEQIILNLFNATASPAPQSSGVSVQA